MHHGGTDGTEGKTRRNNACVLLLRASVVKRFMSFSVAILGAGYIADWHCQALRGVRGVRVVAACDRDAGRARRLADRYGIPQAFTDLAALLDEAKPDVVHVLLPPEHHAAAAEQTLRAGVH